MAGLGVGGGGGKEGIDERLGGRTLELENFTKFSVCVFSNPSDC